MPSNKSRTTLENNVAHIFGFVAYAFISEILFLFTTAGWSGLFYIIFGAPFYLVILVILILKSLFQKISFNPKDWKYLLITQGIFLLINFGDCGDGDGLGTNFFQRVLKGKDMFEPCYVTKIGAPLIPPEVVGIVMLIYIFFLLRLVVGLPTPDLRPKSIKKKTVSLWRDGP